MKKLIAVIISAFALVTATYAAESEFDTNAWSLTIAGSGTTTTQTASTSFGADVGLSYSGFAGLPTQLETGVRQGFGYSSEGEVMVGRTALAADWNIQVYKKLYVFAGAEAAVKYGNTSPVWTAGPEAGVKYFVKKDVYLLGQVNYDFNLTDSDQSDAMRYLVGFGIRFK